MASTVTPQRTQTPDDVTEKDRGEYTEEIVEEVPVVVEWDHDPILHTEDSLLKATESIPPHLRHLCLKLSGKQLWNTNRSSDPKTVSS